MTSSADTAQGLLRVPPSSSGGGPPSWPIIAGLVALVALPAVASVLRVIEVAGGPQLLPENPRITSSPAPLVVHVIAAVFFAIAGALQFTPRLRRRHRGWHRRAGRILVGAGLLVAVTGLWLTVFYVDAPGGAALWTVRLLVGTVTAVSLVLGFAAIRRGDVGSHRAWMIRAYALTVGAGTQTVTEGVSQSLLGFNDLSKFLGTTAGWIINAAVAECLIRRGVNGPRRPRAATPMGGCQNDTLSAGTSPNQDTMRIDPDSGHVARIATTSRTPLVNLRHADGPGLEQIVAALIAEGQRGGSTA